MSVFRWDVDTDGGASNGEPQPAPGGSSSFGWRPGSFEVHSFTELGGPLVKDTLNQTLNRARLYPELQAVQAKV